VGLRDWLGGRAGARAEREAAVQRASAEAAEEDPLFDAELVRGHAASLFLDVQRAWSANDIDALGRRVGPDLMVEWETRLADFRRKGWRNLVEVVDGPEVGYVGIANRAGDEEDRVVVRISARLHDVVVDHHGRVLPHEEGEFARISEYWTLGKRAGDWIVVSIEQEREGAHNLSAPLVPVPESDTVRIRADAVMEVAAEDTVQAGRVGELLSPAFSGTARAAALDLSTVDARFAPDVLATAVGEVVQAWLEAVDGPDRALAERTSPEALTALLYPTASGRDRLVIRGADVRDMTIVAVTPGSPPEVGLELEVAGVQYVEDRDTTAVLAGSSRRRTTTRQRWTLRLVDDVRRPWVVVDATGVVPGGRGGRRGG
jgi:predicted lipid-binding transport protein (Tim44 family)